MKAHLRYLSYVLRHKWFVFIAGLRTGAPLWRLIIHDWSKFTPSEWGAYVANFYGPTEKQRFQRHARQVEAEHYRQGRPDDQPRIEREAQARTNAETSALHLAFDRAWLHHQHANPHHWQHWVLREDSGALKVLAMPEPFVREMVADWMGAGRAITGLWEVAGWYAKNAGKMMLHDDTRRRVEQLISSQFGHITDGSPCWCNPAVASYVTATSDTGEADAA